MKLEADVRGMHNRKLFSAGLILGSEQIGIMKAWGVTEATIVGLTREELKARKASMIPPEIQLQARTLVDASFQNRHLGSEFMEEFHKLCTERMATRLHGGSFSPLPAAHLASLRTMCAEGPPHPRPSSAHSLVGSEVRLLSFPSVYALILKELQSPMCSARRIGEVVGRDPGLTAKILRLVNSPFYGFPSRIDTIERAITILGVNELTTLALGISAIKTFDNIPSSVLSMRHFWEHSMSCGILARLIAGSKPGLSEERFFVAGLLHDIGTLLMLRATPHTYGTVLLLSRDERIAIEDAEKQIFGFTHADVGGLLLDTWSIPETLALMVRNHHTPMKSQPLLDTAIIHLADILALGLRTEDYGAFYAPTILPQVMDAVGLPASSLEPMFLQHDTQMADMMNLFFDGE